MAQGQRAGLITPRSLDRNGLPVSFQFGSFKETARGTYVPLRPLCAEGFKGALDAPSTEPVWRRGSAL